MFASSVMYFAVATLACGLVIMVRANRRRRLAMLRAQWGRPVERQHNLGAIAIAHHSRVATTPRSRPLDERTWLDLDLDAVFMALDRTQSTVGQAALYHRLHATPVAAHLQSFEALLERLSTDTHLRERAQFALSRLQDAHGYNVWQFAHADALMRQRWHIVFPLLTFGALALLLASLVLPAALPAAGILLVLNAIVHITVQARLTTIAAVVRQLAPLIATGQALQIFSGEMIEPIIGSLSRDVRALGRAKMIARWVSGDPLMLSFATTGFTQAFTDLANSLYDFLNVLLLLDGTGVFFISRDLNSHREALFRVVATIGDIDVALSVASLRAERADWTRPRFRPDGSAARFIDIRHPLVANAVPNTITFEPSSGAVITGSNMSGKSTFLRTIGVTAVLAQTIHTCLATEYEAPILYVRSCIGRSDDILTAKSYYLDEVLALTELARLANSPEPHLFLLDELFRGTNAIERIAAGQALLRELLLPHGERRPHIVVAATHDGEIVDLVGELLPSLHFDAEVHADGLVFDHRLRPGRATTRNAIALLRLYGASATMLRNADNCAAALEALASGNRLHPLP
jgi:hypothetical protein